MISRRSGRREALSSPAETRRRRYATSSGRPAEPDGRRVGAAVAAAWSRMRGRGVTKSSWGSHQAEAIAAGRGPGTPGLPRPRRAAIAGSPHPPSLPAGDLPLLRPSPSALSCGLHDDSATLSAGADPDPGVAVDRVPGISSSAAPTSIAPDVARARRDASIRRGSGCPANGAQGHPASGAVRDGDRNNDAATEAASGAADAGPTNASRSVR